MDKNDYSRHGYAAPPAYAPSAPQQHSHNKGYKLKKEMFKLCIAELLLGLVIFAGGIWCARDTTSYCSQHSAIWTSSIYLINAIVGSIAVKSAYSRNWYLAHLVLSVISCMMCVVSALMSARSWMSVGTYHHSQLANDEAFCLLSAHEPSTIGHIYSRLGKYDFSKCLWQLKVGIAVNTVQLLIAVWEIFLNLISLIFCVKMINKNLEY